LERSGRRVIFARIGRGGYQRSGVRGGYQRSDISDQETKIKTYTEVTEDTEFAEKKEKRKARRMGQPQALV